MIRVLVVLAALTVTAAAQPRQRACCDLWIFEPAGSQSIAYAVEVRGSGRTVAVEQTGARAFRMVDDGRGLLRRWRAASHKPDASSVLIDAGTSSFRIGPFEPSRDPVGMDGDTLILIRGASPARAHDFVDDIDHLPAGLNTAMKAAIPARGS